MEEARSNPGGTTGSSKCRELQKEIDRTNGRLVLNQLGLLGSNADALVRSRPCHPCRPFRPYHPCRPYRRRRQQLSSRASQR
jgi:hypothetical protein